jgi:hypothetical protein
MGVSVHNFTQLGGRTDVLSPFIWSCVSDLMQFCDGSDKGTLSNFVQISGKSVTETLVMISQPFREENMGCPRVFEWHVQTY